MINPGSKLSFLVDKKDGKEDIESQLRRMKWKLANIGKKEYKTFQFYALKKKNILVKKE